MNAADVPTAVNKLAFVMEMEGLSKQTISGPLGDVTLHAPNVNQLTSQTISVNVSVHDGQGAFNVGG